MTRLLMAFAVFNNSSPPVRRLGVRGFTLVELLVTVAIGGILVAIAAPNYSAFIVRRQINDQTSAFTRALTLARTSAVKYGQTVIMCQSDNPEPATGRPSCTNKTDWSTGWLIFVNSTGGTGLDTDDTLLRVQPGWSNSGKIESNVGSSLSFRPTAITIDAARTITFEPKNESQKTLLQKVTINKSGRWYFSTS